MAAPNKRFGVSRGVCSRKVLREFESLSPVRTFAFPRPNAKPPTVGGHAGDIRAEVEIINCPANRVKNKMKNR